ncbi:hypothetical protein H8959_007718, partial [Pygathrix nigripes]
MIGTYEVNGAAVDAGTRSLLQGAYVLFTNVKEQVFACPQGHARTRRFAPASVCSSDRTVPVSRDVTHSHHALSRYQ